MVSVCVVERAERDDNTAGVGDAVSALPLKFGVGVPRQERRRKPFGRGSLARRRLAFAENAGGIDAHHARAGNGAGDSGDRQQDDRGGAER